MIVRVDLKLMRVRLLWKKPTGEPYSSLEAVGEQFGNQLVAATNAGIYSNNFTPEGLHIEDGDLLEPLNLREGKGNFYWKPNGVFYINDEGAQILESKVFEEVSKQGVSEATQSGPLLLSNNQLHPDLAPESRSVNVRNGIGVKTSNEIFIVVTKDEVNLSDFASFFKEQLQCRDALYLDGCVSQLYLPAIKTFVPEKRKCEKDFVGIIGVFTKAEVAR